jgi:hypothetical protein
MSEQNIVSTNAVRIKNVRTKAIRSNAAETKLFEQMLLEKIIFLEQMYFLSGTELTLLDQNLFEPMLF